MNRTANEDTIAAIATPPGEGGIGIVRLSGAHAIDIAARQFCSSSGKDPRHGKRRILHGHVVDAAGAVLDEVLLHIMRAPHSYTREDVVEINAHGGMGPLNAILEACLAAGARLARPGEFTLRAFLNGRIDLIQAESVIDTIRARTRAGLLAANAAASGRLSRTLYSIRDRIARALAHVEAAVDFPEEDLPDLVTPELIDGVRRTLAEMRELIDTADAGRLLREGAVVALAGRPNVGKSSLFNALLRDARAIVTPQAGTTRDRLEEYVAIDGVPVRLVDMAGLRATDDVVEQLGVERAREALRAANLTLLLIDATEGVNAEDQEIARELAALETPVVVVFNKVDLVARDSEEVFQPAPERSMLAPAAVCRISAVTGEGLHELEAVLGRLLLREAAISADHAMITRLHQKDSLRRAAESVARMLENVQHSPEFLALDLREALQALGEITGETTPDDLLDIIFSTFCIGK